MKVSRSFFSATTFFPFGYLMLLVAAGTVLRAFRDVLFLDRMGYQSLPAVFLGTTLISLVTASVYVRLSQRHSPVWIACFSFLVFVLALLPIYWFLPYVPWLHLAFYFLVALFNTFGVLQFWALVNHYWDPRTLEQEIPLIGSGGLVGGILGGFLVARISRYAPGTFLWVTLALIILLIPLGCGIARQQTVSSTGALKPSNTTSGNLLTHLRSVYSTCYFRLLGALTLVSSAALILADFQFKRGVSLEVSSRDGMVHLFGIFSMVSSAGALLVQWLLLPALLRQLRPDSLILFLPCLFLFFSAWLFLVPALLPALMLKGSEGILRHTLDRAGTELFYSPIDAEQRYPLKIAIEGTLARAGELIGGLILIVLMAAGAPDPLWSFLALGVTAATWVYLAWQTKGEYVKVLLQWLSRFASTLSVATRERIQHGLYHLPRGEFIGQGDVDFCDRIAEETGMLCQPAWCHQFRVLARTYPPDVVIPCYWGWISPRAEARRFTQTVLRSLRAGFVQLPDRLR